MPAAEYFYIDPNKETVGPISWEVLLQLARAGVVADESLTAPEGASDWIPFAELKAKEEAKSKLPPVPGHNAEVPTVDRSDRNRRPTSSAVDPSHGIEETRPTEIAATVRVEPIKWDIALVFVALVTSIGVSSDISIYVGKKDLSDIFMSVGLLVLVPAVVYFSILHYQCWHVLPIRYRATTPNRAIGFLFIPLFNFYWAFISWAKLADGYEAWQHDSRLSRRHAMKGLGVAQAVFFCLPFMLLPLLLLSEEFPIILIFSNMLGIASLMVFGLFYFKIVNTANQLISGKFDDDEGSGIAKHGWGNGMGYLLLIGSIHAVVGIVQKNIHPFFIAVIPLGVVSLLVVYLRRK